MLVLVSPPYNFA